MKESKYGIIFVVYFALQGSCTHGNQEKGGYDARLIV